jgi:hypothetical protein
MCIVVPSFVHCKTRGLVRPTGIWQPFAVPHKPSERIPNVIRLAETHTLLVAFK